MMRGFLATALLLPALSLGAARAQSADDMINALTSKDVAGKCPPGVAECRGIRAAVPSAGDAAADAAVPARPGHHAVHVQRVVATGAGALDLSIEFPSGSAAITPTAAKLLSRLGQALSDARLASNRFRIEGHTDTVGNAEQNQVLSEKRAASVASYLETNFAIPQARLEPVGLGEKDLVVATPDQTAELRNRRVHVVNLGAG
jgi:outer membrane protein OmpA-like peptidoglycan-associated protein